MKINDFINYDYEKVWVQKAMIWKLWLLLYSGFVPITTANAVPFSVPCWFWKHPMLVRNLKVPPNPHKKTISTCFLSTIISFQINVFLELIDKSIIHNNRNPNWVRLSWTFCILATTAIIWAHKVMLKYKNLFWQHMAALHLDLAEG